MTVPVKDAAAQTLERNRVLRGRAIKLLALTALVVAMAVLDLQNIGHQEIVRRPRAAAVARPAGPAMPGMATPTAPAAEPAPPPPSIEGQTVTRSWTAFLAMVFGVAAGYELSVLLWARQVQRRKGAPSEVTMFASLLRVVAGIVVAILLISFFGKLEGVGATFAGFAGMLMGWSLQAPVSGVAAWVLINLKRPFRTGDRVMLPSWGLIGDVTEVGMMYTVLNQVGGTVGSEEAAGRNILIPNAMLFSNVVINYTPQQSAAYVLDEVVIRITFESDWDTAEQICLTAAKEVTGEIIAATGQEPYIRSDMYDYGVYMRLRYMTNATDRPRIVHELTKRIIREFQRNPKVDLAIPYVYSYRTGMDVGRRKAENIGPEPVIVARG